MQAESEFAGIARDTWAILLAILAFLGSAAEAFRRAIVHAKNLESGIQGVRSSVDRVGRRMAEFHDSNDQAHERLSAVNDEQTRDIIELRVDVATVDGKIDALDRECTARHARITRGGAK